MTERQRYRVVNTLGLIHALVVHPASVQDRDGIRQLLTPQRGKMPHQHRVWADAGHSGKLVAWVREEAGCTVEVVAKPPEATTVVRLPPR